MCAFFGGYKMKTLDQGAIAVAGLQDFPELALASSFREANTDYGHGGYANYGKRLLDVALVLLALPIVIPLIAFCAIALWIESGVPIYRQKRLGQDGRVFNMLKLRTMVLNADALLEAHLQKNPALRREWDQSQKIKKDPRITRFGRFLRATSLDELPQLFNVLVGDMSLVGARPMLVNQLSIYGKADAYFALRPGITGPWQVGERNETSFCQRAEIDELYCRDVSLRTDLRILFKTVSVMLRRTGY